MFRKAVLSLTLWYLAIIMGLSIGFSVALYQVFSRQLSANEQHQEDLVSHSPFIPYNYQASLIDEVRAELDLSLSNLRLNLAYFNIFILLGGGAISYFLSKRTLQPIQEASEAQSRFTGDASHELRTPLTAMRTELEVALRDSRLTLPESKDLHRSTLEEISKLEALSSALLRLSHHDQEKSRAQFSPCNLGEAVTEAVSKVSAKAKERSISVEVGPLPGSVRGDFWGLAELFIILLDNAIKYSPEGSAITVSGSHGERRSSVSIADTGQGIAAADLPRIFDRFYQADTSRTKNQAAGYGLGLSIAKKIVDLHQGSIEVKSTLGSGSTFTVTLPTSRRGA